MITQPNPLAIERRQNAIQVFLLLDDIANGKNFAYHQAVYYALEQGEAVTLFLMPPPREFIDGRWER